MKDIIEIVNHVTKRRLKKIEVLNNVIDSKIKNNYYKLYRGIKENKIITDEDAALSIYNETPSSKKYLMLKSRFRKLLLNSLFFLDIDNLNLDNWVQANYYCNKQLFQVKLLFTIGARESGTQRAKKLIRIAEQYKFNNILLQVAEILKYNYSLTGDEKKFNYYSNILNVSIKSYEAELISDDYYRRLIIKFASSESMKPEMYPIAKDYSKQLKKLCKKFDSYILHFNMYRVWLWSHRIKGNYRSAVEVCEKAEQFLIDNPFFFQKNRLAEIALAKMNCYMHLRDYKNGFENAEKGIDLFPKDKINLLIFFEYYLLLALHTGNYLQAAKIFSKAIKHPLYNSASPKHKEKWRIFEGYLNYIIKSKLISTRPLYKEAEKFNIPKFINELPIYTKDKRGYNVVILVLQILFLLEEKQFIKIIDRTEALKTYRSRYLKKDVDFRSSCFIKMLLIMEKREFNYEETKKATDKYLQMLQKTRMRYEGSLSDLEVIPYEKLWEHILTKLKKN